MFSYRDLAKKETNLEETQNKTLEEKLMPFKFILVDYAKDAKIHEKIRELLKYVNKLEYFQYLEIWPITDFPIKGEMLTAKKIPKGPLYGKVLNSLKESWKHEFNLDTSEETVVRLMAKCDELLKN